MKLCRRSVKVRLVDSIGNADPQFVYFFRFFLSNFLDVHSTSSRVDEARSSSCSIQSDRKVKFLINAHLLNDVDFVAG